LIARRKKMKNRERIKKLRSKIKNRKGMEMVQVAILVAIAIVLGLIFKTEIISFINKTFENLNGGF
jgi:archaellum biogenesis protein FlaJ (TadC family)